MISMINAFVRWLESKPFGHQLLILSVIFDPIGLGAGYLLAPQFGVDPLLGAVYGLLAAGMPTMWWVMRYGQRHD